MDKEGDDLHLKSLHTINPILTIFSQMKLITHLSSESCDSFWVFPSSEDRLMPGLGSGCSRSLRKALGYRALSNVFTRDHCGRWGGRAPALLKSASVSWTIPCRIILSSRLYKGRFWVMFEFLFRWWVSLAYKCIAWSICVASASRYSENHKDWFNVYTVFHANDSKNKTDVLVD